METIIEKEYPLTTILKSKFEERFGFPCQIHKGMLTWDSNHEQELMDAWESSASYTPVLSFDNIVEMFVEDEIKNIIKEFVKETL